MLAVSGLKKKFGLNPVFSDFDLIVGENRFIVLIGSSGCGKSTFFNVLTGVIQSDNGEILFKGRTVSHVGGNAAYMLQKDLLLPWFTLMENTLLPARAGRKDVKAAQIRADAFFKRVGLAGYEAYMPNEVSGGMRQRCALARTLMFDRDFVLLDEPLSALDAITRRSLQSMLLLLQTEFKKSILMITHDIDEALLLADELYLLTPMPMAIREKFVLKTPKPRRFNNPELLKIKEYVIEQLKRDIDYPPG